MTTARLRILSTVFVNLLLTTTAVFAQSGQKISAIEIEGVQTLAKETVIATSGLRVGDAFSVEATDAAAERLVSSGLFKKIGYSDSNRERTRVAGQAKAKHRHSGKKDQIVRI